MLNASKYFLLILVIFLMENCSNSNDGRYELDNYSKSYLNGKFIIADSISLQYPVEAFPKFILDISFSNENIYILGVSNKFPVVKFTKDGKFLKTIGNLGGGPGLFKRIPYRISCINEYTAVLQRGINTINIYKNDLFYNTKSLTSSEYLISDLTWIDKKTLLCTNYGYAKKHILFLSPELDIIDTSINLPKEATYPFRFASIDHSSIGWQNGNIISHHVYPPLIYFLKKSNKEIQKIKEIDLSEELTNFPIVINGNDIDKNSKIDVSNFGDFIGQILFLFSDSNFIFGIYRGRRNEEGNIYLFTIMNHKVIFEENINVDELRNLIVTDKGLVKCTFQKIEDDIKVRLYLLELRNEVLNGFSR